MISAFADEYGKDIGGGYVTTVDGIGGDVFLIIMEFSLQLSKLEDHIRKDFPNVDGIVIPSDIVGIEKCETSLFIDSGYCYVHGVWYLEF